jgi:DNA-binding NarL/FixJ family response regulator
VIRLLVADDHQLIRQALRRAAEEAGLSVVSEATDGDEAVRLARTCRPDVVLMDVTMPTLDGVEATRRIRGACPEARVVVLTMHDDDALRAQAVAAGAAGFLTKDCTMQEVIETVRLVAAGEVVLSAEIAGRILAEVASPVGGADRRSGVDGPDPLSGREREILQLVADGCSTTEIARRLFISAKTVKNHLASIYAKLEARDRTQAVLTGVRRGIIQLG